MAKAARIPAVLRDEMQRQGMVLLGGAKAGKGSVMLGTAKARRVVVV